MRCTVRNIRSKSTRQEIKGLYAEVAEAIGGDIKAATEHIATAAEFFRTRFELTLSPCRHGSWTLSGFYSNGKAGQAGWVSQIVSLEDWMDRPSETGEKVSGRRAAIAAKEAAK